MRPQCLNLAMLYVIFIQMFDEIVVALQEAADDPNTIITATTGSGNVFTAGNDQSNFRTLTMAQIRDLLIRYGFVSAHMQYHTT